MRQAVAFFFLLTTLLLTVQGASSSDHLEYNVHVEKDGSALWTIIQATDINSSIDSWEEFENRVFSTIEAAIINSGRDMTADLTSLEMKTEIFWETASKTIEYVFRWENFSIVDEGQISLGDVFSAGVFSLLYGDGELYMTYPPEYYLKSVSLPPNERDDSTQTLHWYRSQDFSVGEPRVLLTSRVGISNENLLILTGAVLGLGALSAVAIGFLIFEQRRKVREKLLGPNKFASWQEAESDEEKILQLLQFSGGSLYQSEICDKLRFSRAKTSQLLAEMENNNLVSRRKKGKSKIVSLSEGRAGRNS
jgi:hypothetical protein